MTRVLDKVEHFLWRISAVFPKYLWLSPFINQDQGNERLRKFAAARQGVKSIRWVPRRYEPDEVRVDLDSGLEQAEMDVMAKEISDLLINGYMGITLYYGDDKVAHYLMCNGKPYVPREQR